MVEEIDELNVPQEEPETIEHLDAEMSGLECTFEGSGWRQIQDPSR